MTLLVEPDDEEARPRRPPPTPYRGDMQKSRPRIARADVQRTRRVGEPPRDLAPTRPTSRQRGELAKKAHEALARHAIRLGVARAESLDELRGASRRRRGVE